MIIILILNCDKGFNRYRKTDYAIGVIEGLRRKLLKSQSAAISNQESHEVIKGGDPMLAKYFAERYPFVRSYRKKAATFNESVWREGCDAGEKLVISKALYGERTGKEPPLMIGGQR